MKSTLRRLDQQLIFLKKKPELFYFCPTNFCLVEWSNGAEERNDEYKTHKLFTRNVLTYEMGIH